MENKLKYLEMIQAIITRMADNSFKLKNWAVVLASAMLALAANNGNARLVLVAFLPVLTLWILDGYFLWQERLYRALYNRARTAEESAIDFDLKISEETRKAEKGWRDAILSTTLIPFYGAIVVSLVFAYVLV